MEPELPKPRPSFEQAPVQYGQNIERAPLPRTPEVGIETGAERREQASESASRVADATPVLPTVVPIATPVIDPVDPVVDDTPSVANDDDLIEKEWVDKAKKIINETKDDPHGREQAVSKLQAEYLKKRYGKELGSVQ